MAETTNDSIVLQSNSKSYRNILRPKVNKEKVINYFFRFGSFANDLNEYNDVNPLSVGTVVKETHLPDSVVLATALKFVAEANQFSRTLSLGLTSWGTAEKSRLRQARFYLRRAYKVAPVFDYSRAIVNLETLHKLLKRRFYWPHITTQLALTIFVTDRNDSTILNNEYILQKNLRAFCACSAYAFHMARKKLNIGKMGRIGA